MERMVKEERAEERFVKKGRLTLEQRVACTLLGLDERSAEKLKLTLDGGKFGSNKGYF